MDLNDELPERAAFFETGTEKRIIAAKTLKYLGAGGAYPWIARIGSAPETDTWEPLAMPVGRIERTFAVYIGVTVSA